MGIGPQGPHVKEDMKLRFNLKVSLKEAALIAAVIKAPCSDDESDDEIWRSLAKYQGWDFEELIRAIQGRDNQGFSLQNELYEKAVEPFRKVNHGRCSKEMTSWSHVIFHKEAPKKIGCREIIYTREGIEIESDSGTYSVSLGDLKLMVEACEEKTE